MKTTFGDRFIPSRSHLHLFDFFGEDFIQFEQNNTHRFAQKSKIGPSAS